MVWAIVALIAGLLLLIWSADRFVEGSASAARHWGMPSLLVGMVVVGFGTSAPEMVVSLFSALQGNPGIALGNAYGSNITNIALILGLTAIISPIAVQSRVVKMEIPILAGATALAAWQLWDGRITRWDAGCLLGVFVFYMGWSIWQGMRRKDDTLGEEYDQELQQRKMPIGRAIMWTIIGLVLLIASSRLLVWGAVEIARSMGVSDLLIGLTVVAVGTSLPELASSIIAARKGEHDIALGNVIGSNMFNTLAVVGIAGMVKPLDVGPEVLHRDVLVMGLMTILVFVVSVSWRGLGRINRLEGALLLACYLGYTAYLVRSGFAAP